MGPGYDRLGLALPLWFDVVAIPSEAWRIELGGEGRERFRSDNTHPFVRAYHRACKDFGWDAQRFHVQLNSEIPVSSGLGSSAALWVAAAALAELAETGTVHRDVIAEWGCRQEGHPDNVMPAVFGGLRDGNIQHPIHPSIRVLCVTLSCEAATQDMRILVPAAPHVDVLEETNHLVDTLLAGLRGGDAAKLAVSSQDVRHQPYRFAALPQSLMVFEWLQRQPWAIGPFLSGSGPTVCAWILEGDSHCARIRDSDLSIQKCWVMKPETGGVVWDPH